MEELNRQKVINEFETMTKDADRVQTETLGKILEDNSEAEYLQKLGLNGRTDPESFKACVPLASHEDFEPYIQKMVNGDTSPILTGKPITTFSLSSGTTQGKSKYVPFNDELLRTTMEIYRISFAYRDREYPIENGKALQFIYGSKKFKTAGGLSAATATTNVFSSSDFKNTMKQIKSNPCSPYQVIFGSDYQQSLYCHLLCGLIYRDEIQFVYSTFAHSLLYAFRTFEQVWEQLCSDIRHGVLTSRITDPSIKTAMSKLLQLPNPDLADLIHKQCSGLSNWHGLLPALFPNAKFVLGIMTGSMEPYAEKLRHYAGELPLLSSEYGASESWIGANVNPNSPPEVATFTVVPNVGFFEFVPLRGDKIEDQEKPKPVGLTQVKLGQEYEIIVTTFGGLYRYKLGDVVKIAGFHNSTPKIQFVCRKSLILNINIDKNTEKDLQRAVEVASKLLANENIDIIDFTSQVDLSTEPGHYVIYWELSDQANEEVLQECCDCLDYSFIDRGYITSRKVSSIGALELRIVRKGTFQEILDYSVSLTGVVNQFKMPRYVPPTNKALLQILCGNVAKSYFSSAFG